MAVFLTVLKVLLWIILILLGIVLLLVLLILFCPIRYRLKGEMYDDRIEASAKVRFFIISVIINFSKASGLDYAGKVLGIKVYPKKSKPKKTKSKKKNKKKKDTETAVSSTAGHPQLIDSSELDDILNVKDENDQKDEAEHKTDTSINEKAENKTDSSSIDEMNDSEDVVFGKSDKKKKKKKKKDKKKQKKTSDEDKISVKEKIGTAASKASEKAVSVKNGVEEKIEKIETKIDHFFQFLDKPFTQKTIKRCKKLIIRVLKTIKPKKSRADITFGLSNAADTGTMLGRIYQFYPYFYKWLNLQANFYEKGVEGEFDIRGRITLAFIVFPALRILLSRDFKRTRNLAKKI